MSLQDKHCNGLDKSCMAAALIIGVCINIAVAVFLFPASPNATVENQTLAPNQTHSSYNDAIGLVKGQYPELRGYPSDSLPPKSITGEEHNGGWHIAFIQEGSGRQIISAKCFFVDGRRNIIGMRLYDPGLEDDSAAEFSPRTCSPGACSLENCHGLDVKCGSNPPDVCTEMYEAGDNCLQYAKCGVRDGTCREIESARFTQCKSCVQRCTEDNDGDNLKLFECEGGCSSDNPMLDSGIETPPADSSGMDDAAVCVTNPIDELVTKINKAKSGMLTSTDVICLYEGESYPSAHLLNFATNLSSVAFRCGGAAVCATGNPITVTPDNIEAIADAQFKALVSCAESSGGYSCEIAIRGAQPA